MKHCLECNSDFDINNFRTRGTGSLRKFCSSICRQKYWADKLSDARGYKSNIPNGTTGAISELAISMDLMRKQFEVYRALSPSSKCDVLAKKDGKFYDIEIRTGYYNINGSVAYAKNNISAKYLAIYIPKDSKCIYIPSFC